LLACALEAAVTFEILPLLSYAIRETMVSLPERVLKIIFRNTSQYRCHIALDVRNVSKSLPVGDFFNLARVKNRKGLRQVNKVDGPFLKWIS
jgi:hypothetical protein